MLASADPRSWLQVRPEGLYCVPADLYIDPQRPVARAALTHGHADHARPGHGKVLATPGTAAIASTRYGEAMAREVQTLDHGASIAIDGVELSFHPAGHVLGSAQLRLSYRGATVVISGDYKRRPDATCRPFEPVRCDVFVTEATFGLPVFRHPDDRGEIERLLASLRLFPERTHLVGAYALGKAQRVITLLRAAGHDRVIYLHGALEKLCALYQEFGVELGPLAPAAGRTKAELAGEIVIAPPSALKDRWSRRMAEPISVLASGWMRIRARARQSGVELPLVISDHSDWDELVTTIDEVGAPEIWVTHGREEALVHHCRSLGLKAEALALVGFEEEGS